MSHREMIARCILESGVPLGGDPWELADATLARWEALFPEFDGIDEDQVFEVAADMPPTVPLSPS